MHCYRMPTLMNLEILRASMLSLYLVRVQAPTRVLIIRLVNESNASCGHLVHYFELVLLMQGSKDHVQLCAGVEGKADSDNPNPNPNPTRDGRQGGSW